MNAGILQNISPSNRNVSIITPPELFKLSFSQSQRIKHKEKKLMDLKCFLFCFCFVLFSGENLGSTF